METGSRVPLTDFDVFIKDGCTVHKQVYVDPYDTTDSENEVQTLPKKVVCSQNGKSSGK